MRHPNQRSDKILITVPFWKEDRAQAMELSRLIADLEPDKSRRADFAFVARFDCPHDADTIGYVSKKFDAFKVTSNRRETGWPNGCNGTFFGTMDWCLRGISSARIPAYKAIFVCAADTAPLARDAVEYLHQQWDLLASQKTLLKGNPLVAAGAMVASNVQDPNGTHLNGDCVLLSGNPDFLFWLVKRIGGVMRRGGGWDWIIAPELALKGWANVPGIKSHYRRPSFTEEEWPGHVEAGIKWLHGIKDDSLLKIARRKLL